MVQNRGVLKRETVKNTHDIEQFSDIILKMDAVRESHRRLLITQFLAIKVWVRIHFQIGDSP